METVSTELPEHVGHQGHLFVQLRTLCQVGIALWMPQRWSTVKATCKFKWRTNKHTRWVEIAIFWPGFWESVAHFGVRPCYPTWVRSLQQHKDITRQFSNNTTIDHMTVPHVHLEIIHAEHICLGSILGTSWVQIETKKCTSCCAIGKGGGWVYCVQIWWLIQAALATILQWNSLWIPKAAKSCYPRFFLAIRHVASNSAFHLLRAHPGAAFLTLLKLRNAEE